MKPAPPAQQLPQKRMMAGGSGSAKQFSGKEQAPQHQPFSGKQPSKLDKPMSGQTKSVVPPPPAKPTKTIVPPKSFKAQFMPRGALIAIIVIVIIVALGAVGYFFFRKQVISTYEEVIVAIGIKDKPTEEVTTEVVTPETTPVAIATLEDVVFTEKSDPATGTDIAAGSTITYTLTMHNKSDADISDLAITDEIPTGTGELTILSTPAGSTDNSSEAIVDMDDIELKGGENQVVRFQVKTNSDLVSGTEIANRATISKNSSRKISNNNTPSILIISTQLATETTTEEETTPQPTPTPTPTTTPAPTPTLTPTATPAPTVTPAPTTTPAPEEVEDDASPEDMTSVETGGEHLYLMVIFASLAAITGLALIWIRRQTAEK
ncbi:hypothetical protein ACFL0Z_02870 [Patescibacteria group bacterium]